jgi:hypothetical protein
MANELYQGDAVRNVTLGLRVEKTLASLATADMFTVKGEVLITLFYGIVTGAGDGGATTIAINEKADSIPIAAATTVTSDLVGEVYWITGDPDIIILGTGQEAELKVAGLLSAFQHNPIIFDGQDGLIIELTQTGADATHAVKWVLFYIPLEDGAYVEAA